MPAPQTDRSIEWIPEPPWEVKRPQREAHYLPDPVSTIWMSATAPPLHIESSWFLPPRHWWEPEPPWKVKQPQREAHYSPDPVSTIRMSVTAPPLHNASSWFLPPRHWWVPEPSWEVKQPQREAHYSPDPVSTIPMSATEPPLHIASSWFLRLANRLSSVHRFPRSSAGTLPKYVIFPEEQVDVREFRNSLCYETNSSTVHKSHTWTSTHSAISQPISRKWRQTSVVGQSEKPSPFSLSLYSTLGTTASTSSRAHTSEVFYLLAPKSLFKRCYSERRIQWNHTAEKTHVSNWELQLTNKL
jgi:hypothetical protein